MLREKPCINDKKGYGSVDSDDDEHKTVNETGHNKDTCGM